MLDIRPKAVTEYAGQKAGDSMMEEELSETKDVVQQAEIRDSMEEETTAQMVEGYQKENTCEILEDDKKLMLRWGSNSDYIYNHFGNKKRFISLPADRQFAARSLCVFKLCVFKKIKRSEPLIQVRTLTQLLMSCRYFCHRPIVLNH